MMQIWCKHICMYVRTLHESLYKKVSEAKDVRIWRLKHSESHLYSKPAKFWETTVPKMRGIAPNGGTRMNKA